MNDPTLVELADRGLDRLEREDPSLYELLEREHRRQSNVLTMVAASSIADPSVLICEGMSTTNVTTEGYPGARFHAGCEIVDKVECLAIERAKAAFGARYANVQPHSGSSANAAVLFSLLKPGDTLLGMELDSGGHLTHGSRASVTGQYFQPIGYGLTPEGFIDYDQVRDLAVRFKPRLIICGASAYPRAIDFQCFREIADEAGSYLLADISHIAGLVVGGHHASPIDHAHVTTTSTYKQLYGPRGGLILMGKDADGPTLDGNGTLSQTMQRAIFPFLQGTPNLSAIAAKARALALVTTPRFKDLAARIVCNARHLSDWFVQNGYRVLSGGSDNHMVLIDVLSRGVTGIIAEQSTEACGIIINKNRIPGDTKSAVVTSGIRLGTNSLALRGMGANEMSTCASLVDRVLSGVTVDGERGFELDQVVKLRVCAEVNQLCRRFPIPGLRLEPGESEGLQSRCLQSSLGEIPAR